MPSFKAHQSGALPLAIAAAVTVTVVPFLHGYPALSTAGYGITAFIFVRLGAALPDLDHQDSIPRRAAGSLLGTVTLMTYFVGVSAVAGLVRRLLDDLVAGGATTVFLTGLGLWLLPRGLRAVGEAFDDTTTHRGTSHTLPFALLLGGTLYITLEQLPTVSVLILRDILLVGRVAVPLAADSLLPEVAAAAATLGVLTHVSNDVSSSLESG